MLFCSCCNFIVIGIRDPTVPDREYLRAAAGGGRARSAAATSAQRLLPRRRQPRHHGARRNAGQTNFILAQNFT